MKRVVRNQWPVKPVKQPSPQMLAMMKADAGRGLSDRLVDRAFWLDNDYGQIDPALEAWLPAFEAMDKRGDKKPLVAKLKDSAKSKPGTKPEALVSPAIAGHLADLFERYDFKKKPGRPRVPSYDRSDVEANLAMATDVVRGLVADSPRRKGISVKKALDEVSKGYSIPLEVLALAYYRRRGSTQRMKKRRAE